MNRTDHFERAGVEYRGEQQEPQAPKQYVQPGQCFIHINNKRYRLAFTMLQMEILRQEMAKHTGDVEKEACLPYSAIIMGARQDAAKGIQVEIPSFEEVLLWFDEAVSEDSAEYQHYVDAYKASTYYKRFVQPTDEAAEEKKRNLNQTRQEPSLPEL